MQPWPTAFSHYKSRRVIAWICDPLEQDFPQAVAGEVVGAHGDDLVIKCGGETALRLIEVQAEGSRRMAARDFINGARIQIGDKFGSGS
jgi:methionyl-tRNA formyltransferase